MRECSLSHDGDEVDILKFTQSVPLEAVPAGGISKRIGDMRCKMHF